MDGTLVATDLSKNTKIRIYLVQDTATGYCTTVTTSQVTAQQNSDRKCWRYFVKAIEIQKSLNKTIALHLGQQP